MQCCAWRQSSCLALSYICQWTILSFRLWRVWLGHHQSNLPWHTEECWPVLSPTCVPVLRPHGTCRIFGTFFSSCQHGCQKSLAEGDCRPGGKQHFHWLAAGHCSWHHLGFTRVPLPPCGVICWHCLAVKQSHRRDYNAGTISYSYVYSAKKGRPWSLEQGSHAE